MNTAPANGSLVEEGPDTPKIRKTRNWAEDLFSAVQNVACYDAPIPLSKATLNEKNEV